MTVIPVSAIPAHELKQLGNNLQPELERDQHELAAWNRSLAGHDEELETIHHCWPPQLPQLTVPC